MPTIYKRDLSEIDFRLIKRFKHHFLRLGFEHEYEGTPISPKIEVFCIWCCKGKKPVWHKGKNGDWDMAGWRDDSDMWYGITLPDFRAIVRGIQRDIPSVTEGLMIHTLKQFSMLVHTKVGNWKWTSEDTEGQVSKPCILLDTRRLVPTGAIGKRAQDTPLNQFREYVKELNALRTNGVGFGEAQAELCAQGWKSFDELRLAAKKSQEEGIKRRERIDEQIRKRRLKTTMANAY